MTSNIILNVKGTILASQRSKDYVKVMQLPWYSGDWLNWQAVVHSYNASNITITGGGLIDGQGEAWWKCQNAHPSLSGEPCNGTPRPRLVLLVYTTDLHIYNIRLKVPYY